MPDDKVKPFDSPEKHKQHVINELLSLCDKWSKGEQKEVCIDTCPMFWFCSEDRYIAWLKGGENGR